MGPLSSWDIFMMGYQKKISQFGELQELTEMATVNAWDLSIDFEEKLIKKGLVILVTDPLLTIRFASSNMAEMNGYLPHQIEGKTPALFQGPDTSAATKNEIRHAINHLEPFHVSMINYRKNGSTYACDIEAFPVFNTRRKHVHFIAFEKLIEHDA